MVFRMFKKNIYLIINGGKTSPGRRYRGFSWEVCLLHHFLLGPGGTANIIDIQQCKQQSFLFLKVADVILVSTYSVLFKLFVSLFCLNSFVPGVQSKRMGTRAEKHRPNTAALVSWLPTFFAMWTVIQQKYPWLWNYVGNVLWASCSFFFSWITVIQLLNIMQWCILWS